MFIIEGSLLSNEVSNKNFKDFGNILDNLTKTMSSRDILKVSDFQNGYKISFKNERYVNVTKVHYAERNIELNEEIVVLNLKILHYRLMLELLHKSRG